MIKVLVVGTSSPGGINTVIKSFENSGVFNNCIYQFIATHKEQSRVRNLLEYIKSLFYFIFILVKGVDVVHMHCSMRGSFYRKSIMVFFSNVFKTKVIFHLHGSEFSEFYNESSDIIKSYITLVLNNCDVIVVLSESWKSFISTITDSDVFIFKNAVDNVLFSEVQLLQKTKENHNKLLFLGALGQRKGVFDLLKVCKVLNDEGLDFQLTIGGNGDEEKVVSYINKHGLTNVKFVGWVDGCNKRDLFMSSGQLILPSYNEGLPMVILEAMSFACSVVATPVGGIPEVIINNKNGFLIEPGDTDSLYNVLKNNLESFDVNIARSALITQRENFSNEKYFDRFSILYDKITRA
ncbi:glycosyltransferase family 4 protein [Vibrio rumoiensis]|uniref:glycosyltransferase family 4 protein n=1 Tax=Vibrio rumoiensis TaxID=76258 RepID=UPI00374A20D6